MFSSLTSSDIQAVVGLALTLLFLLFGLGVTPNNGTVANKYKRLNYGGALIFIFLAEIFYLFKLVGILHSQPIIGILPLGDFLFFLFLMFCCLWSGSINIHFRKEIDNDTSYKFGLSMFIGGWIIIFYLLAEYFR